MNLQQSTLNGGLQAEIKEEHHLILSDDESESDSPVSQQSLELSEGRWSEQESLKLSVFIHKYQQVFNSKHQRKSCKIFKLFSQYLQRRTPAQCRSHYQKLIIKHKTNAKLKRYFKIKFGEAVYKSQIKRLEQYNALSNHPTNDLQAEKQNKQIGIQTDQYGNEKKYVCCLPLNHNFPFFPQINRPHELFGIYPLSPFEFSHKWEAPCSCILKYQPV